MYKLAGVPPGPIPHPGPGNIVADPLFVNPASTDVRLSPLSPCIDTGNSVQIALDFPDFAMNGPIILGPCPIDYLGNPRDVDYPGVGSPGVIVDMGAIELQP